MRYRTSLRAICNATGLTGLRWRRLSGGLYVFTYHRVGNAATCCYDRGVFSCTKARFKEHLTLFRDRFEVIKLEALDDMIATGRPLGRGGKPLALLTFDDGYIDNYTVIMPALHEFGLTGVFFIATAFIGSGELPWWDQIAWDMRHATAERLSLSGCTEVFDLHANSLERSIMRVLLHVRAPGSAPIRERVDEIKENCRPTRAPTDYEGALFLSWDQIREMHRSGMDIGSHTHSHPVLSHLDAAAQRDELAESKALLEARLEAPVTAVAYPAGKRSGYTPATVRLARDVGYRMGFNYRNARNTPVIADPLDIHRLDVDGNVDCGALKGQICFSAA